MFLPVTQDEAYYFYWAKFLDFGYFDHPPMIAWLASPSILFEESTLASRLLGSILTALMVPISISLASCLAKDRNANSVQVVLLSGFSLGALLLGILQTPDLPQAFFWLLALHEAAYALRDNSKRWLTAGVATGLGITSKYTMLLMGLVFLWTLIRQRKQIFTVWPYLGGLVCFLTLAPHLVWNQNNDWVSFRFQLGRGFASQYVVEGATRDALPIAEAAKPGSYAASLKYYYYEKPGFELPRKEDSKLKKAWRRVQNFIGGQIGLWGLLVFPMLGLLKARQTKDRDPTVRSLLMAATWIPLVLFFILSPMQSIEPNWPAIYIISAGILLAGKFRSYKLLAAASFLNAVVLLLAVLHTYYPLDDKRPGKDRLLRETRGYQELASYLGNQDNQTYLVDTYQNLSQLAFHNSELRLTQWPGIARMSELVRRPAMILTNYEEIRKAGQFRLLTFNQIPPVMKGFEVKSKAHLRACLSGLEIYENSQEWLSKQPCEKPVHRWYLFHYALANE